MALLYADGLFAVVRKQHKSESQADIHGSGACW